VLNDFCTQGNLSPVVRHNKNAVDYTYHFNKQSFACIDHFIVYDVFSQSAEMQQHVLHDTDNTSDHQSINQAVFLEWPKWQATARTTTGVTVNVTG